MTDSQEFTHIHTQLLGPMDVGVEEVSDDLVTVRIGSHRISHGLHEWQVAVAAIDRDLNRIMASHEDAGRRAQEQADLRTLSGEHPAITIEENQ